MKVSVVLCTYALEAYDDFLEAAESVLDQSHDPVELVIVVDGTSAVFARVEDDFGDRERVTLHCNDENRGLLASRNTGAELATGEVVAFIDDDAVADDRWLAELVAAYEAHDAIAVGGRMVPDWLGNDHDHLPAEFYWLVGVTHKGFPEGPTEVRNTFGSNISFRRDVFLDLGGFDPAIGGRKGERNLQGGETELCARMRVEYGRGVYYTPDAVVAHKIYRYRVRTRWLLDRAYWQGYSKRVMEAILPDAGDEESAFLKRLIFEFVPERATRLATAPSLAEAKQFAMLWALTAAVGAGYLHGLIAR